MSTDQVCAYCEHSARYHLDGDGRCGDPSRVIGVSCSCPRFVVNTDTETHEVTAQVLAEADRRKSVLEVAVESERELRIEDTANAGIAEREYAKAVEGRPTPDFAAWGGSHHVPTDLVPQAHYVGPSQSRATKISIIVFHCADQRIQAARAGRHEDAEEWRELIKRIDEL